MTQSRAEKTAYMRQWSREQMKDPETRAAKKEYMRQWRAQNLSSVKAKARSTYLKKRAKILADGKAFRAANPEWVKAEVIKRRPYYRAYHLRVKYGTTAEHIQRLRTEQDDCCAICAEPFPLTTRPAAFWDKEFHIDHCHKTNTVRGLLCFSCNQGIGSLKDSAANALAASVYLSKPTT